MNSKNRTEILVFVALWIGWWLFINFSGAINTIGVFHSADGSLLIPSVYGSLFNAMVFFGNAYFLISRYLLTKQVMRYVIIFTGSFFLIILLESLLDYFYYHFYFDRKADFEEIAIGNAVIDFLLIVIPSFLYRFAKDWFSSSDGIENPLKSAPKSPDKTTIISVKSGKTVYQIPVLQLSHLESDGNYIKYHYDGKYILSRDSLSSQEGVLPMNDFIRCHKSFIVARKHVTKITYESIFLDKIEIPIGRAYREQVKRFFKV